MRTISTGKRAASFRKPWRVSRRGASRVACCLTRRPMVQMLTDGRTDEGRGWRGNGADDGLNSARRARLSWPPTSPPGFRFWSAIYDCAHMNTIEKHCPTVALPRSPTHHGMLVPRIPVEVLGLIGLVAAQDNIACSS